MSSKDPIAEILRAALTAVDDAGVPDELRPLAYGKAVELLAARAGLAPAAVPGQGAQRAPTTRNALAAQERTVPKIAARLTLEEGIVGEVFHVEGDELQLSVGVGKLAQSKREATRQVALLIAAGRQAGGWDAEWTPTATIRTVCDEYGKFDQANFATTISGMSEVFGFSGSGAARKVKVNRKGYEDAAQLVRELTDA